MMDEAQLKEFECPICNNYLGKPIFQCLTGHSICAKCKPKLLKCPYCQQDYVNTRNYAMENLLDKVKIQCKNKMCTEMIPLSMHTAHLTNCSFKASPCKVANCKWHDIGFTLNAHIKMDHKSLVVKNNSILLSHQLTLSIVEFETHMFWIRRYMDNGLIFWTAQSTFFIDPKEKYSLTVKITKAGTPEYHAIQFPCNTNVGDHEDKVKNANMISVHKSKTTGCKFQVIIAKSKSK